MPPAVSTITSLTELAELTMATAVDCLDETAALAPALQYLEAGPVPAWDCCPALMVYVSSLGEEVTAPLTTVMATGHRARYGRVNLVTLNVVVLRCAADPGPDGIPSAAAKTTVAATVQEDGWALWTGFYRAIEQGSFADLCTTVHFDFGQALPEQGNCVGWQFVLRAQLNGIPGGLST